MKSYIKEFEYEGKEGTRKLFVMRENETAIDGFETTYLDEDSVKELSEYFKDNEIRSDFIKSQNFEDSTSDKEKNFKKDWMKSWRRYNKSKIKC
jgi:hypothetical protein